MNTQSIVVSEKLFALTGSMNVAAASSCRGAIGCAVTGTVIFTTAGKFRRGYNRAWCNDSKC